MALAKFRCQAMFFLVLKCLKKELPVRLFYKKSLPVSLKWRIFWQIDCGWTKIWTKFFYCFISKSFFSPHLSWISRFLVKLWNFIFKSHFNVHSPLVAWWRQIQKAQKLKNFSPNWSNRKSWKNSVTSSSCCYRCMARFKSFQTEELGWESFSERRWRKRILQIHTIVSNITNSYLKDKLPRHRRPLFSQNNNNTIRNKMRLFEIPE